MLIIKENPEPPYCIAIDDYLKPKAQIKKQTLQLFQNNAQTDRRKSTQVHVNQENKSTKKENIAPKVKLIDGISRSVRTKWRKLTNMIKVKDLPAFLAFLRARNDDGLCKRKSGFEIYCEMASIHGFINFVNAKTWQRIFWCLIVCLAIIITTIILFLSHLLSEDTPTIVHFESISSPTTDIPFPAVTICHRNYNWAISFPMSTASMDCKRELSRCEWRRKAINCSNLFQTIATTLGTCCAFNYQSFRNEFEGMPMFANSFGRKSGLRVRINSSQSVSGQTSALTHQLIMHDPYEYPSIGGELYFLMSNTEATLAITAENMYASEYLASLGYQKRQCLLPGEHDRFGNHYTYGNCIASCHAKVISDKCACLPPAFMDFAELPTVECRTVNQSLCVTQLKDLFSLQTSTIDRYKSLCKCWPPCVYNSYRGSLDAAPLFYGSQSRSKFASENFIIVDVFYENAYSERLKRDVYENWLTYVATFGGITGLYMGYSFISGFELIFFVVIRPIANWLTKQQIRYRVKRRQRNQVKVVN